MSLMARANFARKAHLGDACIGCFDGSHLGSHSMNRAVRVRNVNDHSFSLELSRGSADLTAFVQSDFFDMWLLQKV